jgi:hypothetical protein
MINRILEDFNAISAVSNELINKYKTKLPEEVIMIWQEYGFGTFYNGYLKVINPDEYKSLIEKSYCLNFLLSNIKTLRDFLQQKG